MSNPTLRKGDRGPMVAYLQKLLNNRGANPKLNVDSDFGNATDRAVRDFQAAKHLTPVDGIVGPKTWSALEGAIGGAGLSSGTTGTVAITRTGTTSTPAVNTGTRTGTTSTPAVNTGTQSAAQRGLPNTSGMSETDKYDLYLRYINRCPASPAAALSALANGQIVLLGLRVTTNSRANKGQGVYDDRIVVLQNKNGNKTVHEFVANTEPSSRYEDGWGVKAYGNDANGDGRKDLGRLPQGVHHYVRSYSSNYGNILRPAGNIRVERDTNHDGNFDANDRVTRDNQMFSNDMLFHPGGNNMTGSAGCQTMAPGVFRQFWAAIGTTQRDFQYVLVTVA
jgi:hypothetical protein